MNKTDYSGYNVIISNNKSLGLHNEINGRLFNCWNSDFCIKFYDEITVLGNGFIKTRNASGELTFWRKCNRIHPTTTAKFESGESVLKQYYKRCCND